MQTFKQFIESEENDVLYHVTNTDYLSKIMSRGLIPMQTSNWKKASGGRYGRGEIYAFDNRLDAIRWAAKMDWDFNKKMGSGKIVIIRFKRGDEEWEIDDSSPLDQAGKKGIWWKRVAAVPPGDILGHETLTNELLQVLKEENLLNDAPGSKKKKLKRLRGQGPETNIRRSRTYT